MNLIIRLLISAAVVLIGAYIIPGISVDSFWTAIIVAIVLGLLNALVRPVLDLLTLPINFITLGLFHFVISVLIIYLTAAIVKGFHVEGFVPALLFSLAISILGGFTSKALASDKKII